MRVDDDIDGILAGPHSWSPRLSAWVDGVLVADRVPVRGGEVEFGDGDVPERIKMTVPARGGGRKSWVPRRASDPLSPRAARLSLTVAVRSPARSALVPMGWFRVQKTTPDDAERHLTVEALGLAQIVQDDDLLYPTSPRGGATLRSEFRRLMSPGLPVEFDSSVPDRTAPSSLAFEGDRLAALYDIADVWPARLRWDAEGVARILPPLSDEPGEPVLTLTDGEGGTVVSAPREASRDGLYNAVKVVGQAEDPDDREPSAVVYHLNPYSDLRWGGSFGRVPAPEFFSPLLTTDAECYAAAKTRLANHLRAPQLIDVTAVADPRVERDDVVQVTRAGVTYTGWVRQVVFPLTAWDRGATMRMTLGVPQ